MPHADRPRRGGRHEHDQKAPDGFTVSGWRRVCKGGYVRFVQGRHYHEAFAAWAGQWVYVSLDDPYGVNVIVFPDKPWDSKSTLRCANENDWGK